MSQFPVIFPYSFGYDGPNALPWTFPVTFGIQYGNTTVEVTVTPTADLHFASANGIAALSIEPASTASAHRIALGDGTVPVLAGITADMYWTMNVQSDSTLASVGVSAVAELSAVGDSGTQATVGIAAGMNLAAETDGSLAVEVGIEPSQMQALGLLDNSVTATAGFTADLTLAASGNASLSGEAMFLANEQELGLLDTTTMWVAVIGADMALSAQAASDTQAVAGFGAGASLSGVMDAPVSVGALLSAAASAQLVGDALLSVTADRSVAVRRTQYAQAVTNAVAGIASAVQAAWNANSSRQVVVSGESNANADYRSWAECYGTATPVATGMRTQYANLNEAVPISFPLTLPFVFGGTHMPGETTVNFSAGATVTTSIDAQLNAQSVVIAGQQLFGRADASTAAFAAFDRGLKLDGYGHTSLAVTAETSPIINAALVGNSKLNGVVFIDSSEEELAAANAVMLVTVGIPAAARLDGRMTASQPVSVGFGNPVLSYPISAVPLTVTADGSAFAAKLHLTGAALTVTPVSLPGQVRANFAANAKAVGVATATDAMRVGWKIAAQLGITNERTVNAIVGLIKSTLAVTANRTASATLQPLANIQVTGWWHFPE